MRIYTPNSPLSNLPLRGLVGNRQPQSTAASNEIGLLFYFRKQFASVIKSFRATPAILRSQLDPGEAALSFSRLVFLAFSEPRTRRIDAMPMGSTSEFRIFRRISRDERDEGIRHGKLLSEIPTTISTARLLALRLGACCHFRTIWCEEISPCRWKLRRVYPP